MKDLFNNEITEALSLADKYLMCPTTVLNKRDPKWQQLKRKWLNLGIKSELGRDTHSDLRVKGRDVNDYNYMSDFKGFASVVSLIRMVIISQSSTW